MCVCERERKREKERAREREREREGGREGKRDGGREGGRERLTPYDSRSKRGLQTQTYPQRHSARHHSEPQPAQPPPKRAISSAAAGTRPFRPQSRARR